jgi:hypothetical protein
MKRTGSFKTLMRGGERTGGMGLIRMLCQMRITAMNKVKPMNRVKAMNRVKVMNRVKSMTMTTKIETKTKEREQDQSPTRRINRQIASIEVMMKMTVVHHQRTERDRCPTLSRGLGVRREGNCRKVHLMLGGRGEDNQTLRLTPMKQRRGNFNGNCTINNQNRQRKNTNGSRTKDAIYFLGRKSSERVLIDGSQGSGIVNLKNVYVRSNYNNHDSNHNSRRLRKGKRRRDG